MPRTFCEFHLIHFFFPCTSATALRRGDADAMDEVGGHNY